MQRQHNRATPSSLDDPSCFATKNRGTKLDLVNTNQQLQDSNPNQSEFPIGLSSKKAGLRAVMMAQWVERLLVTPEIHTSNPNISKLYPKSGDLEWPMLKRTTARQNDS